MHGVCYQRFQIWPDHRSFLSFALLSLDFSFSGFTFFKEENTFVINFWWRVLLYSLSCINCLFRHKHIYPDISVKAIFECNLIFNDDLISLFFIAYPYKVCIQNQFGGSQIIFGVSFFVCYWLPTIKSKHKNKGSNVVKRLILVSVNI